jgi:hypothetical protein
MVGRRMLIDEAAFIAWARRGVSTPAAVSKASKRAGGRNGGALCGGGSSPRSATGSTCATWPRQAGLTRRRQNFDCPACSGRLKARPAEGQGWYRVKCLPRCESVDLPAETRGLHRAAALHTARQLADLKPLWTGYAQPVPQLGPAPPSPPVLAGGGPRGATPDALQRVASLRPDRWLRRPLRHFVPGRASGPCGACRRAEASQCPRRPCKERAAARRPP